MLDELIFFGLVTNMPDDKGFAFLFRMFKAMGRTIKHFTEPLKDIDMSGGSTQRFRTPPLPDYLRKRNRGESII